MTCPCQRGPVTQADVIIAKCQHQVRQTHQRLFLLLSVHFTFDLRSLRYTILSIGRSPARVVAQHSQLRSGMAQITEYNSKNAAEVPKRFCTSGIFSVVGTASVLLVLSEMWVRYNCSDLEGCQGLPGLASSAARRHIHRRDLVPLPSQMAYGSLLISQQVISSASTILLLCAFF